MNRREFVLSSAALMAAPAFVRAQDGLSVLILGGTGFIGPHQVEYALAQGHKVTLFNRGKRSSKFGDAVENLVGDRDPKVGEGLKALEGTRTWDIVIDNSGYIPRHVRASANLLKKRCKRYIYVSTLSVYDFESGDHFAENDPMAKPMDTEEVTGESYGALKAECDLDVQKIYGDRCTVVRPDYIVGPGDHTDRFTYWVNRVNRGGTMLGPSGPSQTASWVDVRDLSPWLIRLGEHDKPGVYNASGPSSRITREGLLWGLRAQTHKPVEFVWPSADFIREEKVGFGYMVPYKELSFGNRASIEAGLSYRPLADTAQATQSWWEAQSEERRANARGWLDPKREAELIEKLQASQA
ncbi:MAG: NAD-dependent epimerase/dehydratase family protein [Pseudomonadota bacterium]